MENLPLLLFPKARNAKPKSRPFPPSKPHFPDLLRQSERIEPKLEKIEKLFEIDRGILAETMSGTEPEFVLVIETASRIDKLQQAINDTEGLEWLAEWDEDISPDEDFYEIPKIGIDFFKNNIKSVENRQQSKKIHRFFLLNNYIDDKGQLLLDDLSALSLPEDIVHLKQEIIEAISNTKKKELDGRLFLTMSNHRGLEELISLWKKWKTDRKLPHGKGKWKEVFELIKDIRRWGIQEQLIETGVLKDWEKSIQDTDDKPVRFQLELFYRKNRDQRRLNESNVKTLITKMGGTLISPFIDMENIGFHAVKSELPASCIHQIVDKVKVGLTDLALLHFSGIMFYRLTGQTIISTPSETETVSEGPPPDVSVSKTPIVAILDGVPFIKHPWLKDRLIVDDADFLEAEYQQGERKHGTAMASLVIHGELEANVLPLTRPVYFRPILQPDPSSRGWRGLDVVEYVPDEVFYEDRIERAVRRMFEREGDTSPQAPDIKIINLSFGDPSRLFDHTLSPCAKLLDWLSWQYKVLFCISVGNCLTAIDLNLNQAEFQNTNDNEKKGITLKAINKQSPERRLISPAESINNITVGAIHTDSSTFKNLPNQVDILPDPKLPSPINRLGYGFRRSIKPEILFSGGRQLYIPPILESESIFKPNPSLMMSGQQVAVEGKEIGSENGKAFTRGTSNATALATRAAAMIYEVINDIRQDQPDKITNDQVSILVKTLLVHGANKADVIETLEDHLKPIAPVKKFKEFISKFTGYGSVDVQRVLNCTEQRATVIGCGTISQKQVHEFRLPLPIGLANENKWRRLTITLSWFTPINSGHRYYRKAALFFEPPQKTDFLHLIRSEADHNQVKRGTVQHEILESDKISDYQDGDFLIIPVQCRADATENLDDLIDYSIAVTLEVKENINIQIYNKIKAGIQAQAQIQVK